MGRKAGIDLEDVIDAAASIADGEGLEAATLSAVARRLGIKTPSLYNHVDGLNDLRRRLAMRGSALLAAAFEEAIGDREGPDALRRVAHVDRDFAARHPGLYDSFLPAPREADDAEAYAAMAAPVFAIANVLLEMGIPRDEAIHLIRAFRATLHGFLDLESKDGFGMPVDIDESFEAAVDLMINGAVVASNRARKA